MPDSNKPAYTAHGSRQREHILEVAETLFIRKGINDVSMSEIASEGGMMRSTLYKYFKNVNMILWEIQHRKMLLWGKALQERFSDVTTTYQRYEVFFRCLLESFEAKPDNILFFSVFSEQYQLGSVYTSTGPYEQVFSPGDFGSKDTVKILMQNFHDGTMRADLDPKETAVTVVYSSANLLIGYAKSTWALPLKYQIEAKQLLKAAFDLMLRGLRT